MSWALAEAKRDPVRRAATLQAARRGRARFLLASGWVETPISEYQTRVISYLLTDECGPAPEVSEAAKRAWSALQARMCPGCGDMCERWTFELVSCKQRKRRR